MRYARSNRGVQHIVRTDGGREPNNPWNVIRGKPRCLCSGNFAEMPYSPHLPVCAKCSVIRDEWLKKARAVIEDYA
jgi:hypothetical protein